MTPGRSAHDGGAQANGAPGGEAGDDWRGRLAETLRFARRQVTGEGEVDEFGFDPEFNTRLLIPLARLLYQQWFRVEMRGLDHVPSTGGALLVANHSGVLPFDAIMLQTGLHDEHPQPPEPSPARRGSGLRAPRAGLPGPAGRPHPGLPRER